MPLINMEGLSPWQKHKQKWAGCTRCPLCENPGRKHVVLARGKIPCDVLFVGEAPGTSENVLNEPFAGPAGHLLDDIIHDALQAVDVVPRLAFTNLVACIPLDDTGAKTEEPPPVAIKTCAERLNEFIRLSKPKVVIAVGGLAAKNLLMKDASITHPAAILRADIAQQSLAIKRCVITLADAFRALQG